MTHHQHRSVEEVLDDHLRESKSRTIEDDLTRNYSPEVVILTSQGVYRGHEGMRQVKQKLQEALPNASYAIQTKLVEGEMGFLEWTALRRSRGGGWGGLLLHSGWTDRRTDHSLQPSRSCHEQW
jgi:hypothetical protein